MISNSRMAGSEALWRSLNTETEPAQPRPQLEAAQQDPVVQRRRDGRDRQAQLRAGQGVQLGGEQRGHARRPQRDRQGGHVVGQPVGVAGRAAGRRSARRRGAGVGRCAATAASSSSAQASGRQLQGRPPQDPDEPGGDVAAEVEADPLRGRPRGRRRVLVEAGDQARLAPLGAPATTKCSPVSVLPAPGLPSSRVLEPAGRPPPSMASRPGTPKPTGAPRAARRRVRRRRAPPPAGGRPRRRRRRWRTRGGR